MKSEPIDWAHRGAYYVTPLELAKQRLYQLRCLLERIGSYSERDSLNKYEQSMLRWLYNEAMKVQAELAEDLHNVDEDPESEMVPELDEEIY